MLINEDFLKQKENMENKKVCPCCSERNVIERKTVKDAIFVYVYQFVCLHCLKAFQFHTNSEKLSKVFFTNEMEVKRNKLIK